MSETTDPEPEITGPAEPGAAGTGAAGARPAGRWGRTPVFLAGAALLGLIAGTCAGYLVQAGRAPTPLPPLSQPTLTQARGPAPEPLSAAQDHKVRTDGDLRRLLLKKPAGGRETPYGGDRDGWLELLQVAASYNSPANAYGWQLSQEFRRAATAGWREDGDRTVVIHLFQYRQEDTFGARDAAKGDYISAAEGGGADSWAIPGTGDGTAYARRTPETAFGGSVYTAEAHAWRGDIAMEIYMYDTHPVPKKTIVDLAKRQMERL
ncbi:hypothetical protein AB0F30_12540 [Streptomyces sp. NPDC029006]|uniref:hypothetical protein n=1 Tax=Streptomyces sp. NPDC029006 TaxID=3155467 RepID=UPI0033DA965E